MALFDAQHVSCIYKWKLYVLNSGRGGGGGRGGRNNNARGSAPTAEQLDAELDAYVKEIK